MSSTHGTVLSRMIRHMKSGDQDPMLPIIDRYLLERERSDKRLEEYTIDMRPRPRPPGRLSPSAMGGCQRQTAFKFMGVPGKRKIDPDQELFLEGGNWLHHMMQAMMHDIELVLGPETFKVIATEKNVRIPGLYISGWLDNIVKIKGTKYVVDYKNLMAHNFNRIVVNYEPKKEHVMQIMAYMKGARIPRGILLYMDRNSQRPKSYVVRYDQQVWEENEAWVQKVLTHIHSKSLPPKHKECDKGNFLYGRCPWAHLCYGEYENIQLRRKLYKGKPTARGMWEAGNEIAKKDER